MNPAVAHVNQRVIQQRLEDARSEQRLRQGNRRLRYRLQAAESVAPPPLGMDSDREHVTAAVADLSRLQERIDVGTLIQMRRDPARNRTNLSSNRRERQRQQLEPPPCWSCAC